MIRERLINNPYIYLLYFTKICFNRACNSRLSIVYLVFLCVPSTFSTFIQSNKVDHMIIVESKVLGLHQSVAGWSLDGTVLE